VNLTRSTRPRPQRCAIRLASLVLTACATVAVAQPRVRLHPDSVGTVTGRVMRPDGPAAHAQVFSPNLRIGTMAETDGTFRLTGVPAGRHSLVIESWYCERETVSVTVKPRSVETIAVQLACTPIPCPKPDRADPGCISRNPEEQARVGRRCEVHHRARLRLDLVPIHYSIGGCGEPSDLRRFPNARLCWGGGCVVRPQRWTEVAYCKQCRAAFYEENPYYVLHPIRVQDR